jgi:hypothetical protein
MSDKIHDVLRQYGGLNSMDGKYKSGQLRSEITRNALKDTGK